MEVVRYINGERVRGAMPALRVGNPGLQEILRTLQLRILRNGEASDGEGRARQS